MSIMWDQDCAGWLAQEITSMVEAPGMDGLFSDVEDLKPPCVKLEAPTCSEEAFSNDLLMLASDEQMNDELSFDYQHDSLYIPPLLSYDLDFNAESSQRSAFKESFINNSRCQSPELELTGQDSESAPSSTSMIKLDGSGSIAISRRSSDLKSRTVEGVSLALKGCESSNNLRQLDGKSRSRLLSYTKQSSSGQEASSEGAAESESSPTGRDMIDLCCNGETLGSDSEESPEDPLQHFTWRTSQMGRMEFIPVSNNLPSSMSCASAATSVGSLKRSQSPGVSQKRQTKTKKVSPAPKAAPAPAKGLSLTSKLLISLSSTSRGPITDKAVIASMNKFAAPKPKPMQTRGCKNRQGTGAKNGRAVSKSKEREPAGPVRRASRSAKATSADAGMKSPQASTKRRRISMSKPATPPTSGHGCSECSTHVTPVWRHGPEGPKTLCNACGVRYMKQAKRN